MLTKDRILLDLPYKINPNSDESDFSINRCKYIDIFIYVNNF